jgi:hypothetical protein
MSLIRNFGRNAINLTKVINMTNGNTLIRNTPYIKYTTNLTNQYRFILHFGMDENIKVTFNSEEERDKEYEESISILEDYYIHK